MYYSENHDDEIFEKASNTSAEKIHLQYDVLRQMVRNYLSNMLSKDMHDENNILECYYPIFSNRYFGIGELEKPNVDKMYMLNDGTIWIHIHGEDDETWSELDEFDIEDMVYFIENIENN
jgi:hypothetical protein